MDAEARGFKRATMSDVVLEVGSQVRVDIDLQVGEVTQTLEVNARTALVHGK